MQNIQKIMIIFCLRGQKVLPEITYKGDLELSPLEVR